MSRLQEVFNRGQSLSWRRFRTAGYVLDGSSGFVYSWDWLLVVACLYTITLSPLFCVFPTLESSETKLLDVGVDLVFVLDIFVKMRTTYRFRGQLVTNKNRIRWHYARSFLLFDLAAAFPASPFASVGGTTHDVLRLLKSVRVFHTISLFRRLTSHLSARVSSVLWLMSVTMIFALVAHLLGLLWFVLAIKPLVAAGDEGEDFTYDATTQYICSLRWAASVMSNTEAGARYCLYEDHSKRHSYVLENTYMLIVLLVGAIIHAAIYGNIAEVVRNMEGSGLRLTKKLENLNEFFLAHNVPRKLQAKIRQHVELAFSSTLGIDVDSISEQFPVQLQLEVLFHLNLRMLRRVPRLRELDLKLLRELVMKVQACH